MKKKTSLSAKLIAAFMAAILGSVLICAQSYYIQKMGFFKGFFMAGLHF